MLSTQSICDCIMLGVVDLLTTCDIVVVNKSICDCIMLGVVDLLTTCDIVCCQHSQYVTVSC